MSAEQEVSGGNGNEWSTLSQAWQAQAVSAVDVEKLRAQTRRRGRRLRWALLGEVLLTLGVLAYLLHVVWPFAKTDGQRWLLGSMMFITLLNQGWSLWIRRRQLRDEGLDARALLSLNIERTRTSILYWGVGVWVGVLMMVALTFAPLHVWPAATTEYELGKMAGGWVGGAAASVGCALFAWAYGRRLRARVGRLQGLLDELDNDSRIED